MNSEEIKDITFKLAVKETPKPGDSNINCFIGTESEWENFRIQIESSIDYERKDNVLLNNGTSWEFLPIEKCDQIRSKKYYKILVSKGIIFQVFAKSILPYMDRIYFY